MKTFKEYILEIEEQENEITFPGGVYISVIPDEITSQKITWGNYFINNSV